MERKKDPGRFTIHFNLNDPLQKAAADILEQQGRKKAQMIASALQLYMDGECRPQPRSQIPIDDAALEKAIMAVLSRHPYFRQLGTETSVSPIPDEQLFQQSEQPPESTSVPAWDDLISQESLHAIRNTLSAFQQG